MPKYRDEDWLREQYVEEHRTTTEIAQECGCVTPTVSKWLNKHGIETRTEGTQVSDERLTDAEWLHEQYVKQRQNTHEIAEECGCARSTVSKWLNKHGIETRTTENPVTDHRLADADWLREQHVEQRRSAPDIADECGCSQMTVLRRLREHDIEATQSNADRRLTDAEWLRKQYVEQGRSAHEIAEERGCAYSTVYRWLRKHGIETTQNNADGRLTDADWLREQYVDQRKNTSDIAEKCGCTSGTVTYWLNKHGIETRSGGRQVQDKRLTDADWLREQYVEERQSTREIAEECGCAASTLRRWLNEHDIDTRSAAAPPPDNRLADSEWLRERYVEERRSTNEIAEECGCAPGTVSRWLSKHDIEARSAAAPISDERLTDAEWLREQYGEELQSTTEIADECDCAQPTVSVWLNKHDIETRSGGGVLSGEDHPSYKGGPAPYGPGWNRRKRTEVRDRDDHTCQDPRCSVTQADHLDEYGEKLHVHHLQKARDVEDPEERNAKANLITLCRDCHPRWEKIADAGLVPGVGR